MSEDTKTAEIADLTATIVANYVSKNPIAPTDLPALIQAIAGSLQGIANGTIEAPKEELKPAVPIRASVKPDHIVCLEDGRKFKSLKRHLATKYKLTPEQYRVKWGLPKDYPMVAPSYAEARSQLAKQMGLGQGGRKAAASSAKGKKATK